MASSDENWIETHTGESIETYGPPPAGLEVTDPFQGYLSANGDKQPFMYSAATRGTHTIERTGTGPDFDLYLFEQVAGGWSLIGQSEGLTSDESIVHVAGASGTFGEVARSDSGSGDFDIVATHPQ